MESSMYRSRFGSSVSVSGDGSIFAVGAKDAINENNIATGAVYLYSIDNINGDNGIGVRATKATLLQELFGSETADDEYGASIALSQDGRRLVIGARSEDDEQNGAIRIYQRQEENEDVWTISEKGIIHGQNPSERCGWAVSISSDGNGEILICTEYRFVLRINYTHSWHLPCSGCYGLSWQQ
jgi:hypothetical protein